VIMDRATDSMVSSRSKPQPVRVHDQVDGAATTLAEGPVHEAGAGDGKDPVAGVPLVGVDGLPGLKDRAVYAVDGHPLEHACHARKDSKGRYVPGNTLDLLCLLSGFFVNFGAVQGDGKYQHEMPVFRTRAIEWLAGRVMKDQSRPIFVGDPAFVDKQFWTRMVLLREPGALVITRTKQNMLPTVYASYGWTRRRRRTSECCRMRASASTERASCDGCATAIPKPRTNSNSNS